MDKKDGGTIDLESLRGFTPGPHPDAQPAPDECFCDRTKLGAPGVSCGDCPTRDYAPKPALAPAADGAGDHVAMLRELRSAYDGNDGFSMEKAALDAAIAALRQPVPDAWTPSRIEYDRSIHSNPDAKAWADMFVETFPGLADKRDLMIGWFASAMMAMHDSQQESRNAD